MVVLLTDLMRIRRAGRLVPHGEARAAEVIVFPRGHAPFDPKTLAQDLDEPQPETAA